MVGIDPNNLSYQIIMTDFYLFPRELAPKPIQRDKAIGSIPYQLVHSNSSHILGNDDGPGGRVLVSFGAVGRDAELDIASRDWTDPEME